MKAGIRKSNSRKETIKVIIKRKHDPMVLQKKLDSLNTVIGLTKDAPEGSPFRLVAELHSITETDKKLYVCAELISGIELQKQVLTKKSFDERHAKQVLTQLSELLLAYHTKGLFYIDVRCEKVIITDINDEKVQFKVVDNGNSLFGKDRIPYEEFKPFYPKVVYFHQDDSYMPPEIESEGLTLMSQVWALGVLGYFIISGSLPFSGPKDKKVLEGPSFDIKHWDQVSIDFKNLLTAMLSISPSERPPLDKLSSLLNA